MHTRPQQRVGYLLVLLTLLAAIPFGQGCSSALLTAAWLLKGNDSEVEFKGLKEKRVAVVCRPMVDLQYRNHSVANDIAERVGTTLKQNVRKVQVVDQREIQRWTDENTWDDYTEVGKAVKADVVVGIDLGSFSIYSGQTVFQGKAAVSMKVYDCTSGDVLFEKTLPEVLYPPSRPVAAADIPENEFRRKFVKVLSERISRSFYAHDRYADLGFGAEAFEIE
jgi:hypothetical protein